MSITQKIFMKGGSVGGIKGSDTGTIKGILETCITLTAKAKAFQQPDTGRLRNSIMYQVKNKNGAFNDGNGKSAKYKINLQPKKFEGYVGTNVNYAHYQEFGTRKMIPQPFLRPAVISVKSQNYALEVKKILALSMQQWTEKYINKKTQSI